MPASPDDAPDEELLQLTEAARRGDSAAVDALMRRFVPELHAFVRLRAGRLVRARESTSDLVQSVCREVLEHIDRLQHPSESAFKRWLFVTALRKIKNRQAYWLAGKRDVLREVPAELDPDAERELLGRYRTMSTPSARLMAREELERVEAAFDELSEEQREVVTLAHLAGLSRAEIAEQIGKSEGAVRTILYRSLARIADLLGEPR